jgi:hypothetical protein
LSSKVRVHLGLACETEQLRDADGIKPLPSC